MSAAVYEAPTGEVLRVIGNNLLVRADPAPEKTAGGIVVAGAGPMFGTGTVLAVGYLTGPRAELHTPIPGLSPGDRILYLRLLAKTDTNPQIKGILGDDVLRIRPSDVLLAMDDEDVKRVR